MSAMSPRRASAEQMDRERRRAGALRRPASGRAPTTIWCRCKLRRGGRILGGSLSWDKPQKLAAFSRDGPFNGMPVPDDVTVTRQVLAEPDARSPSAPGRRSATARRWSPPSAAARACWCCSMSPPTRAGPTCRCPAPSSTCSGASCARRLDRERRDATARGATRQYRRPPSRCRRPACSTASAPLRCRRRPRVRCRPISTRRASADHPPGFYGPPEGLVAVNTLAPNDRPAPLDFSGLNATSRRLSPWRAARPARADLPRRAGAADARRDGGDLAVRRHRQHAAAPARGGNAGRGWTVARALGLARSGAGAAAGRAAAAADRAQPKPSP